MGNCIPRTFSQISAKSLIDTNITQKGDFLIIQKNEGRYIAQNTRTGKTAQLFVSLLRNENAVTIIEIK